MEVKEPAFKVEELDDAYHQLLKDREKKVQHVWKDAKARAVLEKKKKLRLQLGLTTLINKMTHLESAKSLKVWRPKKNHDQKADKDKR